jgi:phage replication-related protein YjqB (UPF0714/DUF867 family)
MAINSCSESLSFQQKVKDIAEAEWERFDRGRLKEDEDGGWQRVGDYWREGLGINDRDGRDTQHKWSAAFISWVMKTAEAGDQFKYSSRHSVYIRDAIQKRESNDSNAAFKGYRLNEVSPQVGDLVCFSSGEDIGKIDYDTTRNYRSHCDIVVATRPEEIDVIGGNVQASVFKKTLPVDSQGYLLACEPPPYWFVVIQNRLQSSNEMQIRQTTYPAIVKLTTSTRREHCSANREQLAMIGRTPGCQIRVKRNEDEYALYTVSKTLPEPPENILLMGEEARSRLGATSDFNAVVDAQVPHPSFDDATAKEHGEFVEQLVNSGTHTGLIVIAPHGGAIEEWTDQQAERVMSQLSSKQVSCWCCKGWKQGGGAFEQWHITSTDIHEASFPCLNTIINRHFTHAVAFHGFSEERILIGGLANNALKQEIQQAIQVAVAESNISVEISEPSSLFGGNNPKNIVNRLSVNSLAPQGNGIQIEQSNQARQHYWQQIADAVASVYDSKLS